MSLNLATLIKVDICRQTDELFERLHNKPFWIWDKEQHKFEDIKTKGDTLEIVYSKKQEFELIVRLYWNDKSQNASQIVKASDTGH